VFVKNKLVFVNCSKIERGDIMKKIIILFIVTVMSFGCNKKIKEAQTNANIFRYINSHTGKNVMLNEHIWVRFVRSMDGKNEGDFEENVFSFSPTIAGKTIWRNSQILEFIPEKSFEMRKEYNCKFDLNSILPDSVNLAPLEFDFTVIGRDLMTFNAEFVHADSHHESLCYQGKVEFSIPTTLKNVKKALSLKSGKKTISLEIEGEKGDYFFKSEIIKRDDAEKQFALKIDKKSLNLADDFERNFSLSSLKEMKLVNIYREEAGNNLSIVLEFSDEISNKQDITGLISIQPYQKIDTKKIGKKIIVSGDFCTAEEYTVIASAGISNKFGIKTAKEIKKIVQFNDRKPQIIFSNNGMYLPSSKNNKIYFRTMNLGIVNLEITKVYESNVGFFIQAEKLNSSQNRTDDYSSWRGSNIKRTGQIIVDKKLKIGEIKNRWLQHELDLTDLIEPDEKGLFVINLSFTKDDILYENASEISNKYGSDYYTNPLKYGYYYNHANAVKPLIISDVGLTYKEANNQHVVIVNNILTVKPIKNANVLLKNYQHQIVHEGITNKDGKVIFPKTKQEVFYVEAEFNDRRSILKLNEMGWNLSTFEVGGIEQEEDGLQVFSYTERGVYRPGDTINFSIIARNDNGNFPDNHPLEIKIYNPQNQLIFEKMLRTAKDGFYHLEYQTSSEDPTGNWDIQIKLGSSIFHHKLKIETVTPERLKIEVNAPENIAIKDNNIEINLQSTYLFGNSAANLHATLDAKCYHKNKTFSKYKTYSFNDETILFKPIVQKLFKGLLDADGKANLQWKLPDLSNVPSAITAKIMTEVFEKGGRSSKKNSYIPIEPYEYYVGIETMPSRYLKVGKPLSVNVILVDNDGQPRVGEPLQIKVYKNNRYWWWEFDSRNDAKLHYKTDAETEVVFQKKINSAAVPFFFEYIPEKRGEYLIEVTHENNDLSHSTSIFKYVSYWGETDGGMQNAGILTIKSDKQKYFINENAIVTFPTPKDSKVLVSIEKSDKILENYWIKAKGDETTITIPLTAEMTPNIYCSISVIQPHSQTENDCPIRMYGVIPILVEDPSTRQNITIKMLDELKPNQPFSCEIQTADKKKTQFTIAVVDEGLLSLTNFKTPNAWLEFNRKQHLSVNTFDNYSQIIGINKGDIFKTFSVGGGLFGKDERISPVKAKRFKAVSMFKGPLQTDENGYAKIEFEMPEYVGTVSVMVVSAKESRYGKVEKFVPVKNDLMVLPTAPRVVAPCDKFQLPITVFSTNDKIKNVNVSIEVDGPLKIDGQNKQTLHFEKKGEKDLFFDLSVKDEIGVSKLKVKAVSGDYEASYKIEISSNPNSPRISTFKEKQCKIGETITFDIPNDGIKGSNEARLTIAKMPNLNITQRLDWLMCYPYGCIEQTTSAVFPQLYLKSFLPNSESQNEEINNNINAAIQRLRKFQRANGGFSYWPGNPDISKWATNYAGHFLIEAKKMGYFVPSELLNNWIKYQQSMAIRNSKTENLKIRVYRLYVLALSGNAEIGAMNLLKENELFKMSNVERWLLSASYHLAGIPVTAQDIAKKTDLTVTKYFFGNDYGSILRDKSMILGALVEMGEKQKSEKMFLEISKVISSDAWYSTQTVGYALLALGKYINHNSSQFSQNARLKGEIYLPNGENISVNSTDFSITKNITKSFGKSIIFEADKSSKLEKLFLTLTWSGIPLNPNVKRDSNGLLVDVRWFSDDKKPLNPSHIKQGSTFYGLFSVTNKTNININEIVLTQMLPSGWEIENLRLFDEEMTEFNGKKLMQEDFVDIRDDRINWFFDLERNWKNRTKYFLVKLNAITVGDFTLPPTYCEAMYDKNYFAILPAKKVKVEK